MEIPVREQDLKGKPERTVVCPVTDLRQRLSVCQRHCLDYFGLRLAYDSQGRREGMYVNCVSRGKR